MKKQEKKEGFMQAVLSLMFSQILIKILGLVYTLYLTNKQNFGDEGNAIYIGAYQIYALLLTVSYIGVPNAISKLVAERTAKGDHKGAMRVFKIAFVTFGFLGFLGTLFMFFGADIIANYWLHMPESKYTLITLSPAIFFVSLVAVFRGYCNGKQSMKITARSQSIEQIFKTIFTIVLVELIFAFTNGNTTFMAAGANAATTLSIMGSFTYLMYFFKFTQKERNEELKHSIKTKPESKKKVLKEILSVSIPMTLSSIMSSFNKNIDSFTVVGSLKKFMSESAAKSQYGILGGKVDTLTSLPLSINVAFATALVPTISRAIAVGDKENTTKRVSFSLMASMLIGLPCTIGMMVFSGQILKLLFPAQPEGTLLLQISALTIIFTILDQTINGTLQGIGKVMVPAISLGVGMLVKLILNLILVPIPSIGAAGAAIGSVACHMTAFIIAFSTLRKNIKLDLNWKNFVIKPLIACIIMSLISFGIYELIINILGAGNFANAIATIIALGIAVIVYAISIIFLKVLKKEDFYMIPHGGKIVAFLEKRKIY